MRTEPATQPAPQAFPDSPAQNALEDTAPRADVSAAASDAPRAGISAQTATDAVLGKQRDTLPPWPEDASLAPRAWLDRIGERVRRADRQGARHSLQRFVHAHPRHPVPAELQRLLVE